MLLAGMKDHQSLILKWEKQDTALVKRINKLKYSCLKPLVQIFHHPHSIFECNFKFSFHNIMTNFAIPSIKH